MLFRSLPIQDSASQGHRLQWLLFLRISAESKEKAKEKEGTPEMGALAAVPAQLFLFLHHRHGNVKDSAILKGWLLLGFSVQSGLQPPQALRNW